MNLKNKKRKKAEIDYEPFIAGALLKFELIDNIDFSLLIEAFQRKTNINVKGILFNLDNVGKYIKSEADISLRDGISLDSFIEEENCTLREKLREIAGDTVNNYFESINVKSYYHKKAKELKENKEKVLNTANVLLISENQEDYDELVKYGFKNVDYFKSLIRADQYFTKYPERLYKYHIVLKGYTCIHKFAYLKFEGTINNLDNNNHILATPIHRYNYSDRTEFVAYLSDKINWREYTAEEPTYTAVLDKIVENTLINHITDKVKISAPKYIDYINPNRLPLPNTKSKLKILYLDTLSVNKYSNDIAESLGLNVTFKEDNNNSLKEYVKSHLGEYDIIIASNLYSRSLLDMNIESTEQCKDTGRDLVLLVSYKDNSILQYDEDNGIFNDGIGSVINLCYKFAGNIAPDAKHRQKEFRVLRKSSEFIHEDEQYKVSYENDVTCIKSILSASINIYNDALLQNKKPTINDLDMKTAEEFDNEYKIVDKQEEERKEAALKPIRAFDNIIYTIYNYLYYRKNGLITQIPEGLKITEKNDKIKVEIIYQNKTLGAITFSKDYKQYQMKRNLRVFEIQTISKKGILSNPQTIGVYTRKYENIEGIPSRPDEKQANFLSSIEKKINCCVKPLNNKAWRKSCELDRQIRLVLERKQKNLTSE